MALGTRMGCGHKWQAVSSTNVCAISCRQIIRPILVPKFFSKNHPFLRFKNPAVIKMAPQLRGFVQRRIRNDLIVGITFGLVAGFLWKFGYSDPLRQKYERYYKNFNAEKAALEMEKQ